MTPSEIVGVVALHGHVRHLIDPHSDSWAGPSGDGDTLRVACSRRLFVVFDGQHDRDLCDGCRRWLSRTIGPDGDVPRANSRDHDEARP